MKISHTYFSFYAVANPDNNKNRKVSFFLTRDKPVHGSFGYGYCEVYTAVHLIDRTVGVFVYYLIAL